LSDHSRQSRLDAIAGDGLKLGGRLALGLLAAPLLGLALLATRTGRQSSPAAAADAPPGTSEAPATHQVAGAPAGDPDRLPDGPMRSEVEDALRRLTDATIPNRVRPERKKAGPKEAAGRVAPATAKPPAKPRRAGTKDGPERLPLAPS